MERTDLPASPRDSARRSRLSPRAKRLPSLVVLFALSACSAGSKSAARPDEGFINVEGGKIWYHRVGNGPKTPLLLLHGGPGATSYGLKPLLALADDRPVIIYDQLGCGKSDHPTDTTLFTVDRYVRELQALRDSLGLTEIHLYGQSWGAMLAEAYMGTKPAGVKSLTLADPLVTTAQWEKDADSLIKLLPDSIQESIATNEAAHTTDSPEYAMAMRAYYSQYVIRKPPQRPADADSSGKSSGSLVYNYMWGPSEFTSTGTLKTFDATQWLRGVTVPTLFIAGEFDEATPSSTKEFSKLVNGSEFVMIPGSGHVTQNDNLEALLAAVRGFLGKVEGTK
ncbi:MAG: proline iminopeptidase-family hydrolase [Gemmatimonadaceae bacterium]